MKFLSNSAAVLGAACMLLPGTSASAQSSMADKCMALHKDKERLNCMRAALESAERQLRAAGIEPDYASAETLAAAGKQAPAPEGDKQEGGMSALGSEQVAVREGRTPDKDKDRQRYQAMIVKFRERVPGRMVFQLDNGQVWEQTAADAQRLHLPKGRPVKVELWATRTGGYRMLLLDQRLTVRVERLL